MLQGGYILLEDIFFRRACITGVCVLLEDMCYWSTCFTVEDMYYWRTCITGSKILL